MESQPSHTYWGWGWRVWEPAAQIGAHQAPWHLLASLLHDLCAVNINITHAIEDGYIPRKPQARLNVVNQSPPFHSENLQTALNSTSEHCIDGMRAIPMWELGTATPNPIAAPFLIGKTKTAPDDAVLFQAERSTVQIPKEPTDSQILQPSSALFKAHHQ